MTLIKTITNINTANNNSTIKVGIDRDQRVLSTIGRARLVPEARLDNDRLTTARTRLVPEATLAPEAAAVKAALRSSISFKHAVNRRIDHWQAAACCAKTKLAWVINRAKISGARSRRSMTTSTRAVPTMIN